MDSDSIDFASEPGSEGTGMHWSRSSAASSGPSADIEDTNLVALQQKLLKDKAVLQNPALRNNVRLISQVLQKRRSEETRSSQANSLRGDEDDEEEEDGPPMPSRVPPQPTSTSRPPRLASPRTVAPWQTVPEPSPGGGVALPSLARVGNDDRLSVLSSPGMRSTSLSVDRFLRAVSQMDSFVMEPEEANAVLVRSASPSSSKEDEEDGDYSAAAAAAAHDHDAASSSIMFAEDGTLTGQDSHSRTQSSSTGGRHEHSHPMYKSAAAAAEEEAEREEDGDESALRAVLSSQTRRPTSSQRLERRGVPASSASTPAGTRLNLQTPEQHQRVQTGVHSDHENDEDEDEDATPRRFAPFPLSPSPSGFTAEAAAAGAGAGPHTARPLQANAHTNVIGLTIDSNAGAADEEKDDDEDNGVPHRSHWSQAADRYQRELLTPVKPRPHGTNSSRDFDDDEYEEEEEHDEDEEYDEGGWEPRSPRGVARLSKAAPPPPPLPAARPHTHTSSLSISAIAAITAAQAKEEQARLAKEAREDAQALAQQQAEEAAGRSRSASVFGRLRDVITPRKTHSHKRDRSDDANVADVHHHHNNNNENDDDDDDAAKPGRFRRFSRRLSEIFGGRKRKKKEQAKLDKANNEANARRRTQELEQEQRRQQQAVKKKPTKPSLQPPRPTPGFQFPTSKNAQGLSGGAHKTSSRTSTESDVLSAGFNKDGVQRRSGGGVRGEGRAGRGRAGRGQAPSGTPPMGQKAPNSGIGLSADGAGEGSPGRGSLLRSRGGRSDKISVLSDLVPHQLPGNAVFAPGDSRTSEEWGGQEVPAAAKESRGPAARTTLPLHPNEYGEMVNVPAAAEKEAKRVAAVVGAKRAKNDSNNRDDGAAATTTTTQSAEDTASSSVVFDVDDEALYPSVARMRQSLHSTTSNATHPTGDDVHASSTPTTAKDTASRRQTGTKRSTKRRTYSSRNPKASAAAPSPHKKDQGNDHDDDAAMEKAKATSPTAGRYFAPYDPESLLGRKRHQAMAAEHKKAYVERRRTVNAHYSHISLMAPTAVVASHADEDTRVLKAEEEEQGKGEAREEMTLPEPAETVSPAHPPPTVRRKLSWAAAASTRRASQNQRRHRSSAATTSASIKRLRRFSPLQFRSHAQQLAMKEARLTRQIEQLDLKIEKRRRQALVHEAEEPAGTQTASASEAPSYMTTPSHTPRRTTTSATPREGNLAHQPAANSQRKREQNTATSRGTSSCRGSPAGRAVTPSPRRTCAARGDGTRARASSAAPLSGQLSRPRLPPLQQYYEDLVQLTKACATSPSPGHTSLPTSTSPRLLREVEGEEEPQPEPLAPRPFLHSVPREVARLRDALYHEYYYYTDGGMGVTTGTPAKSRDATTEGAVSAPVLRPSCGACAPQSASQYASLALRGLAHQLSATITAASADVDNSNNNNNNSSSSGLSPRSHRVQLTVRHELYSPYRGRPEKKPSRKAVAELGSSINNNNETKHTISRSSPVRPLAMYDTPFTPSPQAVILYGLQKALTDAETQQRVAIEEEELTVCLALCENLVHRLLEEAAREDTSEVHVAHEENEVVGVHRHEDESESDSDACVDKDVDAVHTVVVALPAYMREARHVSDAHSAENRHAKEVEVVPSHSESDTDACEKDSHVVNGDDASSASSLHSNASGDPVAQDDVSHADSDAVPSTTVMLASPSAEEGEDITAEGAEERSEEVATLHMSSHTGYPDHSADEHDGVVESDDDGMGIAASLETSSSSSSSSSTPLTADDSGVNAPEEPVQRHDSPSPTPAHDVPMALDEDDADETASKEEEATATCHDQANAVSSPASCASSSLHAEEPAVAHPDEPTAEQDVVLPATHSTTPASSSSSSPPSPASLASASSPLVSPASPEVPKAAVAVAEDEDKEKEPTVNRDPLEAEDLPEEPSQEATAVTDPPPPASSSSSDRSAATSPSAASEKVEVPVEEPVQPRRRSVTWPEQLVTESYEPDIFITNSNTPTTNSVSTSASVSPPPFGAGDSSEPFGADDGGETDAQQHQEEQEEQTQHTVVAETEHPREAVVSVEEAQQDTVKLPMEAQEGQRERPFETPPEAAAVVPTPQPSHTTSASTPTPSPSPLQEAVVPRLSLGAIAQATDTPRGALSREETDVAAHALLDKLAGLDALLLSEFPHYFARGTDDEGRPTAVLRDEDRKRSASSASVPPTRTPSWQRHATAAFDVTSSFPRRTDPFTRSVDSPTRGFRPPLANPQSSQRIPLSPATHLYTAGGTASKSGSGLFSVQRGSFGSR